MTHMNNNDLKASLKHMIEK